MIHIGIIGFGYWGPNVARNIRSLPNVDISWICDRNPHVLKDIPRQYPTAKTTTDVRQVLADPKTDAVVIATPLATHVSLAQAALSAGKHVLVEKPLSPTVAEAIILVALAKSRKRTLMVDHTYLYTPEVIKIRDIIQSGQLGKVFFIDSVRTNLGVIRSDSNVIFDLATHDFSIIDYMFAKAPNAVSGTGFAPQKMQQETVAYITARYPNGLFFHTHVSWLSPVKIRTMMFVGTKRMLVYNDIEPSEKIKIYDKGISALTDPHAQYQLRIGYRTGGMTAPRLPMREGLLTMAEDFVKAITKGENPVSDGPMGIRVIRAVESATQSIRTDGKEVRL